MDRILLERSDELQRVQSIAEMLELFSSRSLIKGCQRRTMGTRNFSESLGVLPVPAIAARASLIEVVFADRTSLVGFEQAHSRQICCESAKPHDLSETFSQSDDHPSIGPRIARFAQPRPCACRSLCMSDPTRCSTGFADAGLVHEL